MSKREESMRRQLRVQAFRLIVLAAQEGAKDPTKAPDSISVIEGQLNVLREMKADTPEF